MNKNDDSQLELFMQTEREARATDGPRDIGFLSQMKAHEKPIILAILFIACGIISFSLGVKRGKALALIKTTSMINLAKKNNTIRNQVIAAADVKKIESGLTHKAAAITKEPAIQQAELTDSVNYAIQVASFRTRKNAEKEASFLEKKGFSTLIRNKGEYAVVYVGKFPDRKKADSVFNELRKKYSDCVMRRM